MGRRAGQPDAAWERWWRTDKGAQDVRYVQFMGKDNVPFHTLSFPATMMGSGEPWKLVDYIKSFNYLNYDGGQFSTSQGRGVFMDQALSILPPITGAGGFCPRARDVGQRIHLGEFPGLGEQGSGRCAGQLRVSRVTKFCRSKFGEVVPEGGAYGDRERALIADLQGRLAAYQAHMDAIEVRKAAGSLRAIWVAGNEYLQSAAPWTVVKTDPDAAAMIVRPRLNLIRFYAVLSRTLHPRCRGRDAGTR
jgi:methionyl-tRNA synthetase